MQDHQLAIFQDHRRMLEGIAYRMLGVLADAGDIVQETYLKWREVDVATLESPRAWLVTVCSRIALNHLQSARRQREQYVGTWLPEPFPDQPVKNPDAQVELNETVSVALLLALEQLSPMERAAFLLHDVFDLSFDEVAAAIGKTSAHCRQLAARARKRVRDERPRFRTTPDEHRKLLEGFVGAARRGDLDQLVSLLADDVEVYSDGGGKVAALPDILRGSRKAAQFFVRVFEDLRSENTVVRTVPQRFNGTVGILMFEDERLATALTVDAHAGLIHRLYAVRNPDKLQVFLPEKR